MKKWTIYETIILLCVLAIISLIICGCSEDKEKNIRSQLDSNISENMIYIKNTTTGICYSAIGYSIQTMCCVPCDSLKNVQVYTITSWKQFKMDSKYREMFNTLPK